MTKEIKIPVTDLTSKKRDTDNDMIVSGSDTGERAEFESKLSETNRKIKAIRTQQTDPVVEASLLLDKVHALLGLGRKKDIWKDAFTAFGIFIENQRWEEAAQACDVMYQSEQDDSIKALAHGVWLAVAFPVDPQLSVDLLDHIVDETPPAADGAAIAATVAHYIVSLRATDEDYENLEFLSAALLSRVAEKHSNVKSQEEMDEWMDRMQLKDPAKFLPRLGLVLNAMMGEDEWWYDREQLRTYFPQ